MKTGESRMCINDWFTLVKIDSCTYAFEERWSKEYCCCYLLYSEGEGLLIDSGSGIGNIKEAVSSVFCGNISVLTTHTHFDHIGGHKYFSNRFVGSWELTKQEKFLGLEEIRQKLIRGIDPSHFPSDFSIDDYYPFAGDYTWLIDREILSLQIGKRNLQVLHTPGHSAGHLCVYEEKTGYLFTGDLAYNGVILVYDKPSFIRSINTLLALCPVNMILPGHNGPVSGGDILTNISKVMSNYIINVDKGIDFKIVYL